MKFLIITYCTLATIALFGITLREEIIQESHRMKHVNVAKPVVMKKAA